MKNQYFGDIHDFQKYAFLRFLITCNPGFSLAFCWMLTQNDQGNDGNLRYHLGDFAQAFRGIDETLFGWLNDLNLTAENRNIELIENSEMFNNNGTTYWSEVINDNNDDRASYFNRFYNRLSHNPKVFVFFDPDNGMEVKSVKKGNKNHQSICIGMRLEVCLIKEKQ